MSTQYAGIAGRELGDFLFTWKPDGWPYENLGKLVKDFEANGVAVEPWTVLARRKIRPGDRAYMLKQGKPLGIFGRGTIVDEPWEQENSPPGRNPWHVTIRFDTLVDPTQRFLVSADQLTRMSAPETQWTNQSSGITLTPEAAREIDDIIAATQKGISKLEGDATAEVERQIRLGQQAQRPDQQAFSKMVRMNYGGRCAITGCSTSPALEAAHIKVKKGFDDNSNANGILLRSDIHALFDNLLVTLSEDGKRIEVSPELSDPSYAFLKGAWVTRPGKGLGPSAENIQEHRKRFVQNQEEAGTIRK